MRLTETKQVDDRHANWEQKQLKGVIEHNVGVGRDCGEGLQSLHRGRGSAASEMEEDDEEEEEGVVRKKEGSRSFSCACPTFVNPQRSI